jgi:transcription elongation factor GreA
MPAEWSPGAVQGTIGMHYVTAEDKAHLQRQLDELKKKRKVLSDRIGRARELGDLRENSEYHSAKDDQGHNERRIAELEKKLASAVVIDDQEKPGDMVFVGATVRLRDVESGSEHVYRLVGETKDDLSADYIEVTPTSPMGLSLLKARVGDTVKVDLPRGEKRFEIVEIN